MFSIMVATIWMTVPVVTIVLLAGRLSLSEELYDAASVDGASVYQRLRHITVPQMRPFFVIVLVLLSLDIARAYDIVRMMTDGGPAHRTELIWTYVGQLAIRGSAIRHGLGDVDGRCGAGRGLHLLPLPPDDAASQGHGMTTSARTEPAPVEAAAPRPTERRRIHWRDIGANWLAFTIIAILALPAVWIILTAFRPNLEVNASPPIWIRSESRSRPSTRSSA